MTSSAATVVALLVMASAVSMMSTDLYTPSLPHLPGALGTTAQAVKLTVSLNVLAFGLAQLILGPVSDRFGRRPVMAGGLALFTLFSLACALAQSIEQLIAARVLQGLSASVEAVVGLAIIRDRFAERDRVRVLAIWGMAIALAPAAAPILGGYVHVTWGWRANFWLVTLLGAVTLALIWRALPESTVPDRDALHPRRLLRGYLSLLRRGEFVRYTVLLGTSLGAIFAFITAGPFILIDYYGVATEHFGYYQAVIVAAFFLGSLLAGGLAHRAAVDRLLGVGLLAAAAGGAALPVLLAAGWFNPASMTVAMSVLAFGLGPIFAIAPSRALDVEPSRIGLASALVGASEMMLSALASASVTVLHDGTARPLALTVLALLVVAAVGWWRGGGPEPAARPG